MPNTSADSVVVAALYRFVALPDFEDLRQQLLDLMTDSEVKGTLLLASEGINGTIAGSRAGIDLFLELDLCAVEGHLINVGFFGLQSLELRVTLEPG